MNKLSLFLISLVFPLFLSGQAGELAKNFKNPPSEFSILPFWSWNGTLKPEILKWQIDQMMEKGIDGAFLHARSGLDESATPYFSDGFWNAVDTTIRYSASKGFHAYLYDEDKWPSGSAGGRTVAANPDEFVKKFMEYSKMEVIGPQVLTLNQRKKPIAIFAGKISDKGLYDFSSQQNLTDKANAAWNVPAGRWAIVSFEIVKDPHQQIDYLNSAAVAKFIEITHESYFKRYGRFFGNTIPGIFFDEIYANGSSMDDNIFWTDDFSLKFRKIKGYDLTDKLPLIIFNDPANSAKIRYDYFDVVAQLYNKAWFKQYADWCQAHNIWATGHTTEKMVHYKRQSDYFTTMGTLQVPGTDNEEYRYGYPRLIDWYNTKQISSIANLYKRERVMAETMGSGGYTIPPEEYRYGFSMLGVFGINLFIPHLFHYTEDTPESQADWPPSWFYSNPYWKYFKPLADFAKRISFLNSQGKEVCDVAILYPLTDLWEGGYPARVDDSFYKEVQQELIDNHINYNIIDPVSLTRATIAGNQLEAGNGKYQLLILPEIHSLRADVMKQISTFVENGGIVVALKSLPELSETGPSGDQLVASVSEKLFGIPPGTLRPEEYYQWNLEKTEHFTVETNKSEGAAFFTRFLHQLPLIINSKINPDFKVLSDNREFLRYNHRNTEGSEIFLLVNDRNTPEKYHISLRNIGNPSVWNPQTGSVQPFENFRIKDARMEFILDFKPRESYFLVLAPGRPDPAKTLVTTTDLTDYRISTNDKSVKVEGWGISDAEHSITLNADDQLISKKWKDNQGLTPLNLSGEWLFQLVPHALDNAWSSSLDSDTLELPVMKFQPEGIPGEGSRAKWAFHSLNDSDWKTVKISDLHSAKSGISRYLSGWNGWWISYYDYSSHLPPIEGSKRIFRKEIDLETVVKEARLAVTADQGYELKVNNQPVGSDNEWKTVEVFSIGGLLKPGKNFVEITTNNTRGLLADGFIRARNGKVISLRSDDSWMVSEGQNLWRPAFRFASPPLGKWGNIGNPLHKVQFPLTVWYRQLLPLGASALKVPEIKGKYSLYINGELVPSNQEANVIDISRFLKKEANVLTLCVTATDESCGLIRPVGVICGKSAQQLISWNKMGLGWYSGRALYTKIAEIPSDYLNQKTRLMLDLGAVDYFAEIWINGKLVTFCPWGPYEADITKFVKPGKNTFSLVIANLSANKATWNILDDNIPDKVARWWHDGSIMREKEKLESGLLGPVRIIPYTAESVEFAVGQ